MDEQPREPADGAYGHGRDYPAAEDLDWSPVLAFLPRFEDPHFVAGRWHSKTEMRTDGTLGLPWASLSDDVISFVNTLYEQGVIVSFDWPAWKEARGRRLYFDADAFAESSLDDMRRMLTMLVRQDRFVEGLLLAQIEKGTISRILQRVAELLVDQSQASDA